MIGRLIFWSLFSLLPRQWPDIYIDYDGLRISDKRKQLNILDRSTPKMYSQRQPEVFLDKIQHSVMGFLEEAKDKIEELGNRR